MKVLVIGGAGRTGAAVVDRLRAEGHEALVMSRRPTADRPGTVTDRAAVTAAARGCDGVVVVVESDDSGDGSNGPHRVHLEGLRNVIDGGPPGTAVVLVSQIYITRPERLPEAREIIEARAEAEALLRASGRRHAIVRPSWLHGGPAGGVRVEQGDPGDGRVSRGTVAAACAAAVTDPDVDGVTFELYDDPDAPPPDWHHILTHLESESP